MKSFNNFVSITLLLLLSLSANSATYYVATTGSNSNAGGSSSPWKSVAYAVSKMVAGDTTYVRSGIYNEESGIRFGRSGTSTAPIRLLNAPGEAPVINFVRTATSKYPMIYINHSSDTSTVRKVISYITIEGFEIRNGHVGIKWIMASNLTFRRNWIHHNLSQGLLGTGGYKFVIDRNRINHNGDFAKCAAGGLTSIGTSTCNQSHGIYANGTYFTITNNLIYDNLAFAVHLAAKKTTTSTEYPVKYPSPEFAGGKNWIITNNTFAYQAYRGAIALWGAAEQVKIENNIFYQNCIKVPDKCSNTQGIAIRSDDRGITINNNLAYATGSGAKLFINTLEGAVQGVHYTASGNIINTLAPEFVNAPATMPSSPNFMLISVSPAINRGVTNLLTKFDFLGKIRQGAYDIGAYEFNGTSSLSVPSIVTNFRVQGF